VSGGSFPSSHFGLYGEESFETFPDQFLYRDIEAFIWGTFLLPWNWDWLFNPLVGTNDRMTQVYDRLMYHGATFADLARRRRPVVSINATDISFGRPFGFLPQSFDVICSDLSKVQVARAVAASNGFPIVFGPVTLRNHRGPECPMPPMPLARDWPRAAEDPRVRHLAETLERYNDPERVQWVHLMDGGIADNLALRVMINDLAQVETQQAALDRALLTVRRVLLLSVDGQAAANPDWPRQRTVSGLGQIFSAVSGTQIDAYNLETELLAERSVAAVVERAKQARCATARVIAGHRCDDVAGMVQPIRLAGYGDDETRARLQAIRTGLTIPRADVDALVAAGESMVQQHALPITAFLERPAAVAAR
jgi:NTE family protein